MNGAGPDVINLNNEASPKKLNPNLRQKFCNLENKTLPHLTGVCEFAMLIIHINLLMTLEPLSKFEQKLSARKINANSNSCLKKGRR